ncbi:MAG: hypothetical protein KGO48_09075 [Alphaproteobacteria bacterium]|nr:hypothetical protein [Alphaproteobacteria bacterium]
MAISGGAGAIAAGIIGRTGAVGAGIIIGSGSGSGGGDIEGETSGAWFSGRGIIIGRGVMQPDSPMHDNAKTGKQLAFTDLLDMRRGILINAIARKPLQGIHDA